MESSHQVDLLNDMAERRPILQNNQNTDHPRFGFMPKTGIAFPKTGFCFSSMSFLYGILTQGIRRDVHNFVRAIYFSENAFLFEQDQLREYIFRDN